MATRAGVSPRWRAADLAPYWPLILGFGVIAAATMASLARQVWSTEIGAHGPIVLATGLWLLVAQRPADGAPARPGAGWQVALLAVPALAGWTFGRAYDFISLEAAGLYGVMLAIALRLMGWRAMASNWFPFLYLGFLVQPPGWVIDRVTLPLQMFVSYVTTAGMQLAGLPITRDGVTMRVAQYQLLVEDACSGMNSIIGLTAISLLYIYLMHRASWRYALLLVALILPIAIVVNIVRVSALVLLTYHFGDAVAQGFLHVTTGMALFMLALLLIFAMDALLQRLIGRGARR